jgi:predicted AlkP superfamily pyrophosphatase or phosphodiesterase
MHTRAPFLAAAFLTALAATAPLAEEAAPARTPHGVKLVVLVVIDQFPGRLLDAFRERFAPGGFRLLLEGGAWYEDAHYSQATTLTAVGHATIATGALPAGHGIPGNDWFDRAADQPIYCVEDRSHRWVGGKGREIDGTSPAHLSATTFSDEWIVTRGFEPRAIGISLKDRGSILLAGKLGKAFWYDDRTGAFVSSTYYYPDGKLPSWVAAFNDARPADGLFGAEWKLLAPAGEYAPVLDDRPIEPNVLGLGRTFPRVLGTGIAAPGPDFYKVLLTVPQGNQLILELARAAIDGEKLGQRGVTDMLLLSLTANDYCGHVFGPESLEYQDMVLQTDRQLEAFFADLDAKLGLDSVLIALTSDHGAAPSPEHLARNGLAVGRVDPSALALAADAALDAAFGKDDWVGAFYNPGLFLRSGPIASRKLRPADVERVAAGAAGRVQGVAETFTRSEVSAGLLPSTDIARAIAAAFHAGRSPDVFVIQKPYWYLYHDMGKYLGMHGSPYAYDTHVPVLFHGPGVRPGKYARRITPADVAPTISRFLGTSPPAASRGTALAEVIPGTTADAPGGGGRPVGLGLPPGARVGLVSIPGLEVLRDGEGREVRVPVAACPSGAGAAAATSRLACAVDGGFSGLARARVPGDPDRWEPLDFWTITDRGPNLDLEGLTDPAGTAYGAGAKLFPLPEYNQSIARLRLSAGGTAAVIERIGLKRKGRPTNGLPSSAEGRPSKETAHRRLDEPLEKSLVPPSPLGYDFEGVYEDVPSPSGDRRFWTCEEYGPSIQCFDGGGNLLVELHPGAEPSGAGTAEDPASAPLPRVLAHRAFNRGFEGITGTRSHLLALLQSPLDPAGGVSGEPGHGNAGARLHRLVRIEKASLRADMLAYDHIADPESFGTTHGEVRIGDLAALDEAGTDFLVAEHAPGFYARIHRITIEPGTTVLAADRGVAYEAGAAAYVPVRKALVLDLGGALEVLPVPAKLEGLAPLDARTVLLALDNDYGFAREGQDLVELSDIEKRALLLEVSAPFPLR